MKHLKMSHFREGDGLPKLLNEDRKLCHKRAQFLRGEGRLVPELCDCNEHVPRCSYE
jgi:hypothetical protein